MADLGLDELKKIMRTCGVAESVDLDGEILDVPFEQLGYDSLAVLEIQGQIEQEFAVAMSDDALEHTKTPRQMLDFANDLITTGA
ncbi:actinorhodin polyketide synthase [Sphaerisporangium rufum]|uniref:Actinorhodin polyketide synthase n=1 Tax=Sphaerisporangium rufum TaxID=1381558 RepID=A0A919RBK6_9ACTN|nr:acyl carrier protein [Sphaerisporangium rufum]GII80977.1 actinorhodin polyketide synthase [Sphaerisporangium rufum]